MQKKNLLTKLLSYITYEKKKKPKEFYIPEINEGEGDTNGKAKSKEYSLNRNSSQGSKKENRGIKKPIPISEQNKEESQTDEKPVNIYFPDDIQSNIEFINNKFNAPTNKDIVIRKFTIDGKYKAFLAFIDGMADKTTINNFILRPLLKNAHLKNVDIECQLDYIVENVLEINQISKVTHPDEVIYGILTGNSALYIDGCNYYT